MPGRDQGRDRRSHLAKLFTLPAKPLQRRPRLDLLAQRRRARIRPQSHHCKLKPGSHTKIPNQGKGNRENYKLRIKGGRLADHAPRLSNHAPSPNSKNYQSDRRENQPHFSLILRNQSLNSSPCFFLPIVQGFELFIIARR